MSRSRFTARDWATWVSLFGVAIFTLGVAIALLFSALMIALDEWQAPRAIVVIAFVYLAVKLDDLSREADRMRDRLSDRRRKRRRRS